MGYADFDLRALYDALDRQRLDRGLTWAGAMREINRPDPTEEQIRPVATSTVRRLKTKPVGEGDGILQMIYWLGRSPESFVPGFPDADAERYRLPDAAPGDCLRWDTKALYAALDDRRREWSLTWTQVAAEIGGCTPGMLTNLAKGPRVGFPGVLRLVRWVDRPAASFTRPARRRADLDG